MNDGDGADVGGFDLGGFSLGGEPGDAFGSASLNGPANGVFDRNMAVLAQTSPAAAAQIRAARPSQLAEWVDSDEPEPGLVLNDVPSDADPLASLGLTDSVSGSLGRVLASRRRPVTEGAKLADSVDLDGAAAVCVYGFGAGYHCRALGERLGRMGAVVCFEPDAGLLRSVFERIDHTAWMRKTNFVLVIESAHPSVVTAAVSGIEAILSLGIRVVEHPARGARLRPYAARFSENLAKATRSMRTSVMTTLVRSQASLQNELTNADHYARSLGVGPLAGLAAGRPAVVVSAGPSLARNLHLLAAPGVRERVVIIAAQTMLKPLLRAGIKPHFVCALDYHELSKRFYEGLTAEDLEGVTLVVEPKANPAILDAFPGVIRCVQDTTLDDTLGADLAGEKAGLKPGATVAHLCGYLGRHLGCDPLIFIGQDLGFTDGQYYAPGAAIHDVWAGELGPMRTLEMFEWERIVRSKGMLRKAEDVLGRTIYTDEQMATYLTQFEVDFAEDAAKGLTVIDATEGGVRKRHARVERLADALAAHASGEVLPDLVPDLDPASGEVVTDRSVEVAARLEEVARQAVRVEALSRKAAGILKKMIAPGVTPAKIDTLVTEVYAVRDAVRPIEPAYSLVQHINQTGALRRFKADREIEMEQLEDRERQRRQIERDIENVIWTADAASELADQLRGSAAAIRGEREKATTDPTPQEVRNTVESVRVGAVLFVDPEINGLGLAREDSVVEGVLGGPAVRFTVERLLRAETLDGVVIATGDPAWARERLGALVEHERVRIEAVDEGRLRARTRAVGRARLMSPDAWRGSLGGLSCYDESFEPRLCEEVLGSVGLDACVVVGADWVLVDPALVDAVVRRYRERPDAVRLSLTQAAPGLAGILLDRRSIGDIASGVEKASNYATIGGVLAYLPVAPQADPIAKAFCVAVPHGVRDAGLRLVPDTPAGAGLIARIIDRLGDGWIDAEASRIVEAAADEADRGLPPRHLQLELCTGRLSGGVFSSWMRGGMPHGVDCERPVLQVRDGVRIIEAFAAGRPDTLLTLHGVGDPLMHPQVFEIIAAARAAGVGLVHLRTDGLSDAFDGDRLVASGLDVLSVDVLAATPEVYRAVGGVDRYDEVRTRVETVLGLRGEAAGLPGLWVVPRITRCDEAYEDIEPFYDGWLMAGCNAVIDPIVTAEGGSVELDAAARIRGLPLPALARERLGRETLVVRSDGTVAVGRPGAVLDTALGRVRAAGSPGVVDAAA